MIYNNTRGMVPEIIVDEKRGVLVHTSAMNPYQYSRYFTKQFKWDRPDLYTYQTWHFYTSERIAEKYLILNRRRIHQELLKLDRWYSKSFKRHVSSNIIESLVQSMPPVVSDDAHGVYRSTTDRAKLVNYVAALSKKVKDYGIRDLMSDSGSQEKLEKVKELYRSFLNSY